ncbi:MAG: hypothetical protein K5829_08980 [Treponema sp.]|nr:hypothetical protein [Treponema sp.]
MKICPKCGKQYSVGNYCEDCEDADGTGVKLVEGKVCENCGHVVPEGLKRCTNCGIAISGKAAEGIGLGDKNVVAGDINSSIQHNENIVDNTVLHNETYTKNYNTSNQVYNTSNNINNTNTTNIINQDETKKMVQCHICGKNIVITDAITCRKCGNTVCKDCFNTVDKSCIECSSALIVPKGISPRIQQFAQEIRDLDETIAIEHENLRNTPDDNSKKWWSSWKGGKKFWYVVLNIYTFAIPVILHFLIIIFKKLFPKFEMIITRDVFTVAEKNKKALIENLIVNNDKDEIIEFLNIAKLQRELALKENNIRSMKWLNIWGAKTNQVINKAKSFYSADSTFMFYIKKQQRECNKDLKKGNTKLLFKNFSLLLIVLLIVGAIIIGTIVIPSKSSRNIPSETHVAAENIRIIGFFDDYVSVSSDGAVLKYRPNDKKIEVIFSLIPNEDGNKLINKKIDVEIANKKWKKEDCIYEVYDYCYFYINDEPVEDLSGDRYCNKSFSEFYSMKKDVPVKFDLIFDFANSVIFSHNLNKKNTKFMNSEYLEINPALKYEIMNNAEDTSTLLEFSKQ